MDTETGLIEKVRRRLVVGDALAPTVAAVFLAIGGIVLIVFERSKTHQPYVSSRNLRFVGAICLLLVISLSVMRYAGPVAVWIANLMNSEPLEYRLLRDTAPWKYIGYFFGGTMMITGLISLVESKFTWRALRIAVGAVIVFNRSLRPSL